MNTLQSLLKNNDYPGRGIILGVNKNGHAVVGYFIMGRSQNSRNRIFVEQKDGISTQPANIDKVEDTSLTIYAPVRMFNNTTIVSNGDQTDTIYDYLKQGKTFEDALRTRTFEPDPPIYTPRISGIVVRDEQTSSFSYKLSILKSSHTDEHTAERFFYEYDTPEKGVGHFIHTYKNGEEPIQSFCGDPCMIEIPDSVERFAEDIWESLNEDNKISLFLTCIEPDGKEEVMIYNKYTKDMI